MFQPNPANRPWYSRLWYESLRVLAQLVGVLGLGVRVEGRENIPATGGVLVVSNHQSHFDPPLVGMGSPRRMNYLARESLFRFTALRWLIKSLDAIPIDRDGFGLSGIKQSLRRLKRGEMLLVFPEGTRTRDGEIGPFKPGFTTLAVRGDAWILPVAVEGAFEAWPRRNVLPTPGNVRVLFAPPISPEQVRQWSERELLAEVERRVRAAHRRLRA